MRTLFESLAWQALGLPPEITPVPSRGKATNAAADDFDLLSSVSDRSWHELNGHAEPTIPEPLAVDEENWHAGTLPTTPQDNPPPAPSTTPEPETQQDNPAPVPRTPPEANATPDPAPISNEDASSPSSSSAKQSERIDAATNRPFSLDETPGMAAVPPAITIDATQAEAVANTTSMPDKDSASASELDAPETQRKDLQAAAQLSQKLAETQRPDPDLLSAAPDSASTAMVQSRGASEPSQANSAIADLALAVQPALQVHSETPQHAPHTATGSTPQPARLQDAAFPSFPSHQDSAPHADPRSPLASHPLHPAETSFPRLSEVSIEPHPASLQDTPSRIAGSITAQPPEFSPASMLPEYSHPEPQATAQAQIELDEDSSETNSTPTAQPASVSQSTLPGSSYAIFDSPSPGDDLNTSAASGNDASPADAAAPVLSTLYSTLSGSTVHPPRTNAIPHHPTLATSWDAAPALPLADEFIASQSTPAVPEAESLPATSQLSPTAANAPQDTDEHAADFSSATYSGGPNQSLPQQRSSTPVTRSSVVEATHRSATSPDAIAPLSMSQAMEASAAPVAIQATQQSTQPGALAAVVQSALQQSSPSEPYAQASTEVSHLSSDIQRHSVVASLSASQSPSPESLSAPPGSQAQPSLTVDPSAPYAPSAGSELQPLHSHSIHPSQPLELESSTPNLPTPAVSSAPSQTVSPFIRSAGAGSSSVAPAFQSSSAAPNSHTTESQPEHYALSASSLAPAQQAPPPAAYTPSIQPSAPPATQAHPLDVQMLNGDASAAPIEQAFYKTEVAASRVRPSQGDTSQAAANHEAAARSLAPRESTADTSIARSLPSYSLVSEPATAPHATLQQLAREQEAQRTATNILPEPLSRTTPADFNPAESRLTASATLQYELAPPPQQLFTAVPRVPTHSSTLLLEAKASASNSGTDSHSLTGDDAKISSQRLRPTPVNHPVPSTAFAPPALPAHINVVEQTNPFEEEIHSAAVSRNTDNRSSANRFTTPAKPPQTPAETLKTWHPVATATPPPSSASSKAPGNANGIPSAPAQVLPARSPQPSSHSTLNAPIQNAFSLSSSKEESSMHSPAASPNRPDPRSTTTTSHSESADSFLPLSSKLSPYNSSHPALRNGQAEQPSLVQSPAPLQLSAHEASATHQSSAMEVSSASLPQSHPLYPVQAPSAPVGGSSISSRAVSHSKSAIQPPLLRRDEIPSRALHAEPLQHSPQSATSPANPSFQRRAPAQPPLSQFTAPRIPSRASLRRSAFQPEPAPLRIDIGRIEVNRSDLSSSSTQTRKTRSKTKFTLDQYLKQRTRRR